MLTRWSMRAVCALVMLTTLTAGCQALIGLDDRKLVAADSGVDEPDSGSDAEVDAGATGATDELCDAYCATVMDACTGNYAVYPSLEVCHAVCALLPPGDIDDSQGNSVQCRYRAARTITEQPADCPAAGPGGAGRCGDNCAAYCGLMDQLCDELRLPSVEECTAKCGGLRDRDELALEHDDSRYSAGALRARDFEGDTVQCRLLHLSLAAGPEGAAEQCWQAAIVPRAEPEHNTENPCLKDINQEAVRCEDYCKLNMVACQGEHSVYESKEQCVAACGAMPLGELTDSGGQDTLGCRRTHSYNALTGDPGTHCPHSGPTGATVCGDDCTSFCTQLKAACGPQFEAEYGTDDAADIACVTDCMPLLEGEPALKYATGDDQIASLPDLGCRMRAAARAHVMDGDADLCKQAIGADACE